MQASIEWSGRSCSPPCRVLLDIVGETPGDLRYTVPALPPHRTACFSLAEGLKTSGNFRLGLPPELAHPANRPRHSVLRGSERILLIAEPAHEAAQFHANEWLRTQARDDRPNIQLMHLGELPRRELGVRVVPGAVVTGAQDNGGLGRTVVVGLFTPCPG